MTFGYSRDDVAKFLPIYLEKGILKYDPFQVLDVNGVGQLVREAVFKGRSVNPKQYLGGEGGTFSMRWALPRGRPQLPSPLGFACPHPRLAAAHAALKQQ